MDDLDRNHERGSSMKRTTNMCEPISLPNHVVLSSSYLIDKTMTDILSKSIVQNLLEHFLQGVQIRTSYTTKTHTIPEH